MKTTMVPPLTDTLTIHTELDARGLSCPMPLLKAKQAMRAMPTGAVLKVRATDPGSWRDFQVWSEQSGHELLSCEHRGQTYQYILQKR
jgi:TusA-related sulfurtransferase